MGRLIVSLCLELLHMSFHIALCVWGCPTMGSMGACLVRARQAAAPSLLLPDHTYRKYKQAVMLVSDLQGIVRGNIQDKYLVELQNFFLWTFIV